MDEEKLLDENININENGEYNSEEDLKGVQIILLILIQKRKEKNQRFHFFLRKILIQYMKNHMKIIYKENQLQL